ncbi:S8 family serine peptidase [Lusitaniella coriacea]|uniref:S8 family serine peptidase n=1 Tax=Lusitaniella coriacea TaxID=1983105 RepID=UPI003CF7E238
MRLFQKLFGVSQKDRTPPEGFGQTFILEPILTPSGLVDSGDDFIDPTVFDLDSPVIDDFDLDIAKTATEAFNSDVDIEEMTFLTRNIDLDEISRVGESLHSHDLFTSGTFTVGDSGEVSIDFLFDGGKYEGELAIFSLDGMEQFEPGSDAFIQEAASRALSSSELGHVVISDPSEGAKFSGNLGERSFNEGDYQGVKSFQMRAGSRFGVMLVPNGTIEQVYDNPDIGGSVRPLFSMATSNPDDAFHVGQIADATGDGNTFVLEDLRVDGRTDRDYNDIIFQVRGATGDAVDLDEVINADSDWRETDMGEALTEYAKAYVNDVDSSISPISDTPKADQPLIGIIDTGFSTDNPDLDYSRILLGQDRIDGDDNPLLNSGEGNEHGTHVLGIIGATQDNDIGIDGINDDAPLWVGRAVGSGKWAESLVEFVDAAQESGQPNAVVNLSMDLTQIDADGNVTTRYEFTPLEMTALEYARQNDVLVAVAAGNDGGVMSALGQASQQFDNIITVGSAEPIDSETSAWKGFDRAEYSSYGIGLDIVADAGTLEKPIFSTVGDGIGVMSGTSVATAQVTGAASQVWAANPELSYRQVIEILKSTATDLKTDNSDLETGSGLLNIAAAIHLAKTIEPEEYDPDLRVVPTTWSGEGKVTPMERAAHQAYQMQQGETLWAIAARELGSGNRWIEITKDAAGTMPFTSTEAAQLPIGQIVYIPDSNSTLNSQASQQGIGTPVTVGPLTTPTQNTQTLVGKKIILDPGHGKTDRGFDPGAVANGTNEAIENLHQAKIVAEHLRQLGAEVKVLDESLSLAQIGQRAAGHDLFVSLHQNAFNSNAQGHEVYSHPNAPAKDAELAQAINSELDAIFPDSVIPNRGVKTANFSVLSNAPASVPAVLVESLFIDAPGMSRTNVEKASTAVARGIEKFLTGQVTGSTPTPAPSPPPAKPGVVNSKVGSDPLNFRVDSYVGANIIDKLSSGTSLKILKSTVGGSYNPGTGSRNDWYQVEVNGQTGYVAAYYVDVILPNQSPGNPSGFHPEPFSGWVGPSIGVALRNSPRHSDKSGLAEPYKKTLNFDGWMYGESVTDIWTGKADALWYRYWRNGKAYWVPSAYINGYPNSKPPIQPGGSGATSKPGYVKSGVGLNFRTSPSANASRISRLRNGTNLTILEQVSGGAYYPGNRTDWYRVKVGNTVGYVAAYYVREGNGHGGGSSTNPNINQFIDWAKSQNSIITRRDRHHLSNGGAWSDGQCVTLIARYIQDVFMSASERSKPGQAYNHGYGTAGTVSGLPDFGSYTTPAGLNSNPPRRGGVISFMGSGFDATYGHVGIVTRYDAATNHIYYIDIGLSQGGVVTGEKSISATHGAIRGWTNPK